MGRDALHYSGVKYWIPTGSAGGRCVGGAHPLDGNDVTSRARYSDQKRAGIGATGHVNKVPREDAAATPLNARPAVPSVIPIGSIIPTRSAGSNEKIACKTGRSENQQEQA